MDAFDQIRLLCHVPDLSYPWQVPDSACPWQCVLVGCHYYGYVYDAPLVSVIPWAHSDTEYDLTQVIIDRTNRKHS
jgi:hypothetical protein